MELPQYLGPGLVVGMSQMDVLPLGHLGGVRLQNIEGSLRWGLDVGLLSQVRNSTVDCQSLFPVDLLLTAREDSLQLPHH